MNRILMLALALMLAAGTSAVPSRGAVAPVRVVALMPSIVEDLYAVGAGPAVVAVSAFTDDVPQAKGLPRVADFSSVDAERIVALHPDLVLGIPAQDRLVDPLRRAGVRVVLIPDDSYDDIFSSLRDVGDLTGHAREAAAEIASLQRTTAALRERTRSFVLHPTVFVALGTGPIWTVGPGSYIATLIEMAGGRNAASGMNGAYGEYSAEALLSAQPDAIVSDRATRLDAVLDRDPWRSLKAVRDGRVYVVEPSAILERPGPRYNEGLSWLIERLAPLATH